MPKMKMNFDFSKVKQYVKEKGERVALVACGAIAFLLIVFNLMGAMGAGKPEKGNAPTWSKAFDDRTKALAVKIQRAETDTDAPAEKADPKKLVPKEDYAFIWPYFWGNPWVLMGDVVDTKRRRPPILVPRAERVDMQYLQGGYFTYELAPNKVWVFTGAVADGVEGPMVPPMPPPMPGVPGVPGVGENPVKKFKPMRAAVVSLVFPMKEQIEIYRAALGFATVEELMIYPDLLPQPTGLIVYRSEWQGGKWSEPTPFYTANAKGEPSIHKDFKQTLELFHKGVLDLSEFAVYGKHAVGGLMTPLPALANLDVPVAKLDGIEANDTLAKKAPAAIADGAPMGYPMGDPMMPPAKGGGRDKLPGDKLPGGADPRGDMPLGTGMVRLQTKSVEWDKFPKEKPRWQGKINPFPSREDVAGIAAPLDGMPGGMPPFVGDPKKGVGDKRPPMPLPPPVGDLPGVPGALFPTELPDDALIRFIDADVQAGKSYKYWVRVRMANPNHGDKHAKDVAFKELIKDVELLSPFWEVPHVFTAPHEFFFYAVDEAPHKEIKNGPDSPKMKKTDANNMAFQIHRWIEYNGALPVGDWAIAERLVIRKGEFIGRAPVNVEVPEWADQYNAFHVHAKAPDKKLKKGDKRELLGIPVDFRGDFSLTPSTPAQYALVDFAGGKVKYAKSGLASGEGQDEGNLQALILTPEGRLVVQNSSADMPASARVKRIEFWKDRVDRIQRAMDGGGAAGGMPPMGGGLPGDR